MLKFNALLQFPPFYRSRYGTERTVDLRDIKSTEWEDDKFKIITFSCISNDKYETIIELIRSKEKTINIRNCFVKVYCGCDSFKYEFSSLIENEGSLFKPVTFDKKYKSSNININSNLKKNKYGIISPCKHLVRFSNAIITKLNNF